YGTLFDVFSVTALCEQLFPGRGEALAQLWRAKQLRLIRFRGHFSKGGYDVEHGRNKIEAQSAQF
ncbi:MAG TPA: hypothetical protein VMS40_14185, partial [Vicinamibacterales bacterium]|nr:hypothetical protein [Vicinamibacterales bacterium]